MTSKKEYKARRAAWVAALRSGKYAQINSKLKTPAGYCCLGVACEVAGIEAVPHYIDGSIFDYSFNGNGHILSSEIIKYYGLLDEVGSMEPLVINGFSFTSLVNLNDGGNFDFNKIADIIESEPEGLFIE